MKKLLLVLIIVVVVLTIWFFVYKPMPLEAPGILDITDTAEVITKDLEDVDISNLDMEFQAVDEELNQL